jgi:hypothetical protein
MCHHRHRAIEVDGDDQFLGPGTSPVRYPMAQVRGHHSRVCSPRAPGRAAPPGPGTDDDHPTGGGIVTPQHPCGSPAGAGSSSDLRRCPGRIFGIGADAEGVRPTRRARLG